MFGIIKIFLISFFLIGCSAVKTTEKSVENARIATQGNIVEEIGFKAKNFLSAKYYNYDKKPKVLVRLAVNSSIDEESASESFLHQQFSNYFNMQNQIKLTPNDTTVPDAIVELHFRKEAEKVTALMTIRDSVKNQIIFSSQSDWDIERFITPEYLSYKTTFQRKPIRSAKLLIKAKSFTGDATKEANQTMIYNKYSAGLVESYEVTRERGYSGFYPAELRCAVNGKVYEVNSRNICFDEVITPGRYDVEVSFREGSWDAKSEVQTLREEYRKRFHVYINEGKNIEMLVIYMYDGFKKDIKVQAFTKKEVEREGRIQEYLEVIEIFSK